MAEGCWCCSPLLWGTTGTAQAFASEGVDSVAVGALRLTIGGAALLLLALGGRGLGRLRDWPEGSGLKAGALEVSISIRVFLAGLNFPDPLCHPEPRQRITAAAAQYGTRAVASLT